MTRLARVFLAALLLPVALASCRLGPDYQQPEMTLPQMWRQQAPPGQTASDTAWWDLFQDDTLRELVTIALNENKDLGIAAARVDEARARYGFTHADQFPVVNLAIDATRFRTSEQVADTAGGGDTHNFFSGRVEAFYEVDLWGKYRRATEAARAELLGSEMARQTVVLSLVSDVATAYVDLLDLDNRLAIARTTLQARTEYLRIITARFDKGIVSALDVRQAEIQQSIAAAAIPQFERQLAETEDRIRILLGRFPGDVPRGRPLYDAILPPDVPAGITSDLLVRRPDVQSAEAQLVAANARIGVAEAQRFPLIALTASAGAASSDLSDITKGGAGTWSIAGALLQPLFNFGKNKRRVEIARAQTQQALFFYEGSVQQAFREVEDALAAVRTSKDSVAAYEQQVKAARSALTLSTARYDQGVTSYLEVLIQQTQAFDAELAASVSRRDQLASVIRLYTALGGGWGLEATVPPSEAAPAATAAPH
ncbi:MAG TPA: efflux transporter outer membrane subunit [Verrucomicrobiae bacterium]|nr:efflux transporter outer membrane subunit [Verrucomicrobiae bacterium]